MAERLLKLRYGACEAADDSYQFASLAFVEPHFEQLFLRRCVSNRFFDRRAFAKLAVTAALLTDHWTFERSAVEKSHESLLNV